VIQQSGKRLQILWQAFAELLGAFLDEAAFRSRLCWRVATGQLPAVTQHRSWNYSREVPLLVNVFDWTTSTLLFTVMVWPATDQAANTPAEAKRLHLQRAECVMQSITRGATEIKWSLFYEVEEQLKWDDRRALWVTHDGVAYEYPKKDG
jgi:hypothetical protein